MYYYIINRSMLIMMANLFLLISYCLSNINAYIEEEGYHCGVTGQSEKPPIGYELPQITNVHKLKAHFYLIVQ